MKRVASHYVSKLLCIVLLLLSVWLSLFNVMGIIFLNNHGALFNDGVGLETEIISDLLLKDMDTL